MRFLSPEWLDRIASTASASTASAPAPGVSLAIHQRVTGGPDGDVEFTIRLDQGACRVEPGPGAADVDITEDYATASAISQGHLTPSAAFAAGRLQLQGSIGLLVAHQATLAALGAGMGAMAAATTY
ncbi:MAG: SCP2 sterol-binding domain-containing protein [Actinomycetota bacterium]|nr:SCP2 sterol-binding domain-containing protein [Actinomycetota bacterium]